MLSSSNLTTAQVLAVFAEEVAARGGHVTDTFDDGQRLLTRSVLPRIEEVRAGDQVQGGVALKASAEGSGCTLISSASSAGTGRSSRDARIPIPRRPAPAGTGYSLAIHSRRHRGLLCPRGIQRHRP